MRTSSAPAVPITAELTRVSPAVEKGLVMAGYPYGGYQESDKQVIRNAIKFIKAGANFVKIQGSTETALRRIKSVIDIGIPCMGHVGLTPHSLNMIGGFKVIGKVFEEAKKVYEDVMKLQEIGISLIEMECVPAVVAKEISRKTEIPIIGIGSGNGTDGQVLAFQDILGLQKTQNPRHVKKYVDLWTPCVNGLKDFIDEVKDCSFPAPEHSFEIVEEEFDEFKKYIG